MKSLWNWFWKSSNRWIFAGVLFVAGVIVWGGFNTFMEYTNRMEFCIGCHEMRDNVYAEYTETIHYTNRTGVRALCSDCHVPKEWVPKLIRKIRATNELYHWYVGTIDTKEKYEAHRLQMARNVWTEMKVNDSRECRNCHSYDAMHWEKQGSRAQKTMKAAREPDYACVECHKGIAHKLPDMAKHYAELTEKVQAAAAADPLTGSEVHVLAPKSAFMEKDTGSDKAFDVEPLTPLQVLERDGDWLKVRLTAWDREGGTKLFAKAGPAMQVAKLGFGGMDAATQEGEYLDTETELTWHRVTVEGWTRRDHLVSDKQVAWDYAEALYNDDCNLCHVKYEMTNWPAVDWVKKMNAMRRYTKLEPELQPIVLKFIQSGSKDMVAAR